MEFLLDSLVLHKSHCTSLSAIPVVNLAPVNRASVLCPDEAHLLGVVTRGI